MRLQCEIWLLRKIPPIEDEIQPKNNIALRVTSLIYWPIVTKIAAFVAHAGLVLVNELPGKSPQWKRLVRKGTLFLQFSAVNYWPTGSRACVESRRCELSGKSLPWKPRHSRKGTLLSKSRASNYWAIATKLAKFVALAWKLRRINIQGNSSNGNWDRAGKAHCSANKVPLITDRW